MALSEQDKQEAIANSFNPEKVYIYCGHHSYYGPNKQNPNARPAKNCAKCWEVYFWHDIATCPASMRAQRLDELEEVLHKVVEEVTKGTWDFEPYAHPIVEFGQE